MMSRCGLLLLGLLGCATGYVLPARTLVSRGSGSTCVRMLFGGGGPGADKGGGGGPLNMMEVRALRHPGPARMRVPRAESSRVTRG